MDDQTSVIVKYNHIIVINSSFIFKHLHFYTLNKSDVISVQRMCHTCQYFSREGQQLFCKLLEVKLDAQDLRLDCPEHKTRTF